MFRSRVNQPTRIFVNSSDDTTSMSSVSFNSFRINLQTPILNAKRLQLLRATIPNTQVNIPDYMLCFFYWSMTSATDTTFNTTKLRCVRLYPSNYVAPAGLAFTKNRFFSDPADFVTQLNTAASAGGDNATYNPYWVAGDVTFAYNATTKQITMTGNTAGRYYAIAGWNDPIVLSVLDPAVTVAAGHITMPNNSGGGTSPQPFLLGYTLNLRVGYAISGNANAAQVVPGPPRFANLTNQSFANGTGVPVDSFPNLVYTGSIYLYSDIVAGSSVCSNTAHNLLAVIPVNAPQLGVVQYVAATLTWLDKIPDNIYEVRIIMLDENDQPFNLPDSAVMNVELGIGYEETK